MEKKKNKKEITKKENSETKFLNIFWGVWAFIIIVLFMIFGLISTTLNSQMTAKIDCGGNILGDLNFNHRTVSINKTLAPREHYIGETPISATNTTLINVPEFENFNLNKISGNCKIEYSGNLIQLALLENLKERR